MHATLRFVDLGPHRQSNCTQKATISWYDSLLQLTKPALTSHRTGPPQPPAGRTRRPNRHEPTVDVPRFGANTRRCGPYSLLMQNTGCGGHAASNSPLALSPPCAVASPRLFSPFLDSPSSGSFVLLLLLVGGNLETFHAGV